MNGQATASRKLIDFPPVQTRLNVEEEQVLLRVLREAHTLSVGPEAEAFEKEWTEYLGCGDSVAVCNCSAALELAAILSGIGPGDEVILPAHTFVATAVPFARTGATLRWADIDPDTRVISGKSIASLITEKTKVIVVVHLYGLAADMDAIMPLADQHDLFVVEDCAQASGARYKGRQVGSIGHFGCFSFQTAKNITTLGEGGMFTVRDPQHAVQGRRLRWMGIWPFEGDRKQYWLPAMSDLVVPIAERWPQNFCMGEPNAGVGRLLMNRLDGINEHRRTQARRLANALVDYPELSFQQVPDGCKHAYHLMAVRYDGQPYGKNRDDLIQLLLDKYQLKCIVQYWPLYRAELFESFGFGQANVPHSDHFFDNMISIPWWSNMTDEIIDDIAVRLTKALAELRG